MTPRILKLARAYINAQRVNDEYRMEGSYEALFEEVIEEHTKEFTEIHGREPSEEYLDKFMDKHALEIMQNLFLQIKNEAF